MKEERILILKDFFATQMNYWTFFPIAVTIIGLAKDPAPRLVIWVLLSFLPFLFFLTRRYANHLLMMVAVHVAVVAVVQFLPCGSFTEKIMALVFAAGFAVCSFCLRVKEGDHMDHSCHPGFSLGVGAVALLFQHYQGRRDWDMYYVIPLILVFGAFLIQFYIESYLQFLVVNESSTGHIPKNEIFQTGIRQVFVYTGAGMCILLLSSGLIWLTTLTRWLKEAFAGLLVFLLKDASVLPSEEIAEESNRGMEEFFMEPSEPFWLWQVLEKILTAALLIVTVVILFKGIVSLFRYLKGRLAGRVEIKDETLESVVDVREKCGFERTRQERRPFMAFLSPAERIRRIYKKKIWTNRMVLAPGGDTSLLGILTARECGRRLENEELADIYEKARYSGEECTTEDVRAVRNR